MPRRDSNPKSQQASGRKPHASEAYILELELFAWNIHVCTSEKMELTLGCASCLGSPLYLLIRVAAWIHLQSCRKAWVIWAAVQGVDLKGSANTPSTLSIGYFLFRPNEGKPKYRYCVCFHLTIFFSMSTVDVSRKQYLYNDVDNRRGFEITQFKSCTIRYAAMPIV